MRSLCGALAQFFAAFCIIDVHIVEEFSGCVAEQQIIITPSIEHAFS